MSRVPDTEPSTKTDFHGNTLVNAARLFSHGRRILQLTARPKDGCATKRTIHRVSRDEEHFGKLYSELRQITEPGERIYVTVAPRDIRGAAQKFTELQATATFQPDWPDSFYGRLERTWVSCLMKSPAEKIWMFDIDTERDKERLDEWMAVMSYRQKGWWTGHVIGDIPSKSGTHRLMRPFNKSLINSEGLAQMLHGDPLVLLCYKDADQ